MPPAHAPGPAATARARTPCALEGGASARIGAASRWRGWGARLKQSRRAADKPAMASTYKVVETSDVTDVALEQILNDWTAQGYRLESIHFAMRESSRRPSMAFLLFVREAG
jgi:hypothetical protein